MRVAGYSEFKTGWPVVLSALLGIGLGLSPLPFYTIGVFAPYFVKTFGWTFGQVMAGITVTTGSVLIGGPLAGMLAAKYGARRVAIISLVLFAVSFMGLAFSTGSLPLYYATWALVAFVGSGTLPITWTVAVNQRFEARKGLALGISMMGTGLFGFFAKPLLAWLIPTFGWRGAYIGVAILPLAIALPAALLLYREVDTPRAAQTRLAAAPGQTLGQALGQWRFWLIALVLLPVSFALAGPLPNMENILKTAGFSASTIVKLASLIGLSALTGRLIGGWLLDLFWAPAIALLLFLLPSLSCYLLSQPGLTTSKAMISIILIGFTVGVEYDLVAYLVARYFGMRGYTAIYGLLYVFFAIGAGVGPLVFGWSYDQTHSYRLILEIAVASLLIGGLALLTLGRYRYGRLDQPELAVAEAPAAAA